MSKAAANDNNPVPPSEKIIGSTLATMTVLQEHLTNGLQAMLEANGVSPEVRDGVGEFVRPMLALADRLEADVLGYARQTAQAEKARDVDMEPGDW